MRHGNHNRKLGRESNGRRALLRSLARNLISRGKIQTTTARAKELRPFVEKLVTQAKAGTLTSRRLIIARLSATDASKTLIETIAPRYLTRAGGYTRIVRLPARTGSGRDLSLIEFV